MGAFSLRATGLVETLDALVEQGLISKAVAKGIAFILRPPRGQPASEAQSVTVPLNLQDKTLFLGPLPVLELPSPPWVPLPASES